MNNIFRIITLFCIISSNIMASFTSKTTRIIKKNVLSMKKDNIEFRSLSQFYKPKTQNQEMYVKYLNDQNTKILFAVGPAGTGKTMLACNSAIRELKSGSVNKIIITRPLVPVEEEEIGFLPGNMNKKMDPWTRPIFDVFLEFYAQKDIDAMLYNNVIEISPLAFMRGRTFKNSYIIADEMQNSSPNQMLMLTTRIGLGSKMVITGDLKQRDKGIMDSGLVDFINKFKTYNSITNGTNVGIKMIELNSRDIERHPVIVNILDIYNVDKLVSKKNQTNYVENPSIQEVKTNVTINSTFVSKNLTKIESGPPIKQYFNSNNDAALIPISHMSRYLREK